MHALKAALRKKIIDYTGALPEEYIEESNEGICKNLLALPEYQKANTIFAYYSIGREPGTHSFIERALADGKTIALPISLECGMMEAHVIKSLSELVSGEFNIPAPTADTPVLQPNEIDLILVPGVTFDEEGYRLGRGGGYYDRYLSETTAFAVGLAREKLLYDVPRESHDMGVRCLITEKKRRDF